MARFRLLFTWMIAAWCGVSLLPVVSQAQTLRFDSYREMVIPDKANVRYSSFYSDLAFVQSVGARYTRVDGDGSDYLFASERGRLRDDGAEFPLVSQLSMRNYFLLSKYMDLDLSFLVTYRYFPMGTEDDEFDFDMAGLGLSTRLGAFTLTANEDGLGGAFNGNNATASGYTGKRGSSGGFRANLSSEFDITDVIKGRVYDSPSYRVDYVDERGRTDDLRGRKYRVLQNTLGLDVDWLMAKNKNLSYSALRTDTWPQDESFDQTRSTVTKHSLVYQQQLNPVTLVGARADYTWRVFDEAYRGNQFQQDYLAFLGADLTENTTLKLGGGVSDAELTDPGLFEQDTSSDSWIGYASLSSKLTERTSHSIGYSRRQDAAFNAGLEITDEYHYAINWRNDVWSCGYVTVYDVVEPRLSYASDYTDWYNTLTVTRALTRTLTALASAAYTERSNGTAEPAPASAGVVGEEPYLDNDYTTWAVNLGIAQAVTDNLSIHYYAEHLEQMSDNSELESSRDTIGLTVTYSHDF